MKTKPFKVTKYDILANVGKDENLFHYFIFVIKNKNKDTHNIQIKQTVLYFEVQ